MPEGHTIHRLARDQSRELVGTPLTVEARQERFAASAARLNGATCTHVDAYGKHLFNEFSTGDVLHVHLGLIGKWRRRRPSDEPSPSLRLRLATPDRAWDLTGPMTCELIDPGTIADITDPLGPDPLRRDGRADDAWERLARRRAPIGQLLMDQTVIAGLGNVYRSELLFLAGIHPSTPAPAIDRTAFDGLWTEAVRQLRLGVRRNRIVTRSPQELGRPASKVRRADAVYVYKRDHCRWCGSELETIELAGRTAWACPVHQPR